MSQLLSMFLAELQVFTGFKMELKVFMSFFMHFAFRAVFSFHEVYMEYFFIDVKLNWFDAQQYCRENYTDLATISSMEDLMRLKTPSLQETWIGMFDDPASWKGVMGNDSNSWRWSVTGTTSPGAYQNWKSGEPDNMGSVGSSQLGTKKFFLIESYTTWMDALSYCRQHYTDLATIEDNTENAAVNNLIFDYRRWIGLYREPWRWSDGSTSNFTNWALNQPDNYGENQHCVIVDQDRKWQDTYCSDDVFSFHCEKGYRRLQNGTDSLHVIFHTLW
ncbi:hypothetical protein WMY93_026953 [Mugilogobius chulae]|uniref:C-type lectin domain-containing protein n=1 Tax=Mugilogobius chulae TaxID=88201 RepID=A0AAW0MVQ6_9GOBI